MRTHHYLIDTCSKRIKSRHTSAHIFHPTSLNKSSTIVLVSPLNLAHTQMSPRHYASNTKARVFKAIAYASSGTRCLTSLSSASSCMISCNLERDCGV